VAENGSAIILLGVRRDESEVRRRRIDGYENHENSRLHPHNDLAGAYIYRPIVDLTTDEVWELLAAYRRRRGGDNSRLIKLYRDAAGGECPIVLSQDDAPLRHQSPAVSGAGPAPSSRRTRACRASSTAAMCSTPR
jgi:DNA sulfur modification protein DndC